MIKQTFVKGLFAVTTLVVIAVWTVFIPLLFLWHICCGVGHGFRYAGYVVRAGYVKTVKNFLAGWKTL